METDKTRFTAKEMDVWRRFCRISKEDRVINIEQVKENIGVEQVKNKNANNIMVWTL